MKNSDRTYLEEDCSKLRRFEDFRYRDFLQTKFIISFELLWVRRNYLERICVISIVKMGKIFKILETPSNKYVYCESYRDKIAWLVICHGVNFDRKQETDE